MMDITIEGWRVREYSDCKFIGVAIYHMRCGGCHIGNITGYDFRFHGSSSTRKCSCDVKVPEDIKTLIKLTLADGFKDV